MCKNTQSNSHLMTCFIIVLIEFQYSVSRAARNSIKKSEQALTILKQQQTSNHLFCPLPSQPLRMDLGSGHSFPSVLAAHADFAWGGCV